MLYFNKSSNNNGSTLQLQSISTVGKLFKAATKDVNDAWRMDLPIEFEDVANEENEQESNANQSEDELSECDGSSSCAGSE